MHDVRKWPNILQRSCGVRPVRFLKPFFNILDEMLNRILENVTDISDQLDAVLYCNRLRTSVK